MLRANDLIWSFVVNNYLLGKDPFPFDLLYWNCRLDAHAGARCTASTCATCTCRTCWREPGGITLAGVPIDLSKVTMPAFICRPSRTTSRRGRRPTPRPSLLRARCSFVLAARATSPASSTRRRPRNTTTGPTTRTMSPPKPGRLAGDRRDEPGLVVGGLAALARRIRGGKVPARDPGEGKLKAIEDAPGVLRQGAGAVDQSTCSGACSRVPATMTPPRSPIVTVPYRSAKTAGSGRAPAAASHSRSRCRRARAPASPRTRCGRAGSCGCARTACRRA